MSEEQLAVRQTILYDFAIPAEYNLVIINASSETSLKIKSPVAYVIVHSGDEDTEIHGRARVSTDCCYYLTLTKTGSAITWTFATRMGVNFSGEARAHGWNSAATSSPMDAMATAGM